MIKDMTKGNPAKVLIAFFIPAFISVLFQQMYNIADSVIVGRFVGSDSFAAIGASYPIVMIFMAFAIGLNTGCSVIVSQFFGAKRNRDLKTAVTTSYLLVAVVSIVLAVTGLLMKELFLVWLSTPDNIFEEANIYLSIYLLGLVFLFFYNVTSGIFNALGDSRTPLYFLIASSLGNIVLDLVFVITFGWGLAGAAWATFIAQGVSAVLSFVVVQRRVAQIKTNEKPAVYSGRILKIIVALALPCILQQSFVSVGNLLIQGLVNGFGSSVIAGYSAAIKLNTLTVTCFVAMSGAVSFFTAQNIGAGDVNRVHSGFKTGVSVTVIIASVFFGLYYFAGDKLIMLFVDGSNHDVIKTGQSMLKTISPFYFLLMIKLMADAVLKGASCVKAFTVSTFADLILRVVLAFVLCRIWGLNGIWRSWPVGWGVAMLLSITFYTKGIWKRNLNI